jgi:hypothetical protein
MDFGTGFHSRAKDGKSMLADLIRHIGHFLREFVRGRQLQARNEIAADMERGR